MMTDLVYERLRDDAGFGALAGDRYYTGERPSGAAFPLAVGRVISETRPQAMGSSSGVVFMRLQVTCMAERSAQARALAKTVRTSLHRWRDSAPSDGDVLEIQDVFLDNALDTPDPAAGAQLHIQDYLIFYRES